MKKIMSSYWSVLVLVLVRISTSIRFFFLFLFIYIWIFLILFLFLTILHSSSFVHSSSVRCELFRYCSYRMLKDKRFHRNTRWRKKPGKTQSFHILLFYVHFWFDYFPHDFSIDFLYYVLSELFLHNFLFGQRKFPQIRSLFWPVFACIKKRKRDEEKSNDIRKPFPCCFWCVYHKKISEKHRTILPGKNLKQNDNRETQ